MSVASDRCHRMRFHSAPRGVASMLRRTSRPFGLHDACGCLARAGSNTHGLGFIIISKNVSWGRYCRTMIINPASCHRVVDPYLNKRRTPKAAAVSGVDPTALDYCKHCQDPVRQLVFSASLLEARRVVLQHSSRCNRIRFWIV